MKLKKIKRDANGLITGASVKYQYDENGLIDWRRMVKSEHLVPNRQRTSETDVSKLEDNQLIILLGGIKELAQIRGYTDVHYDVHSPSPDYVVATCSITWIPNYETEDKGVTFSGIGDASPNNTQSFAKFFLGPIAENRAFVRCVRNFLRINIVGQEELPGTKLAVTAEPEENQADPVSLLKSVMKDKGVTFDKLKVKLVNENYEKVNSVNTLDDIPKVKIFELIERIKKIKKTKD
tara:strand:+ start:61 stop:768 length:708 start_codon:yes stop_codon:yes gene_type:complete